MYIKAKIHMETVMKTFWGGREQRGKERSLAYTLLHRTARKELSTEPRTQVLGVSAGPPAKWLSTVEHVSS